MQSEPAPQWTPEQGRRYELLREIITIYVGNIMAEIYAEEAKADPRKGLIAALNSHLADVHAERKALRVQDDAQIAAGMAKYEALNKAFDEARTIAA